MQNFSAKKVVFFGLILICYLATVYSKDDYPSLLLNVEPKPDHLTIEQKNLLKKIVTFNRKVEMQHYKRAFNPSIVPYQNGYLVIFRHCPSLPQAWLSYMGVVLLNKSFRAVTYPQLLPTPISDRISPSQTEDPRLFNFNDKIYVIYNDNPSVQYPQGHQRRDMFIGELQNTNGYFFIDSPTQIISTDHYNSHMWQKNWSPFVWNDQLLFTYSVIPHEVIQLNPLDGNCDQVSITPTNINWKWGTIRGGTPALLVDGEYLSFFHSSIEVVTKASRKPLRHYYMGAYTFSANPPFNITRMTPFPIVAEEFYTFSQYDKRVIFPGGFIDAGDKIILAYGKDDQEIWIAKINKQKLKEFMQPVN